MNRDQLEHHIRAAADVVDDNQILVIGSQSILGTYDESVLPIEATTSIEADLGFFNDPDHKKADLISGAIGEGSEFEQAHGVYADGVDLTTATLPEDWRGRLVILRSPRTGPAVGYYLEPHDCVIAKLVAHRPWKDLPFAASLLQRQFVSATTLLERLDQTSGISDDLRQTIIDWIEANRPRS